MDYIDHRPKSFKKKLLSWAWAQLQLKYKISESKLDFLLKQETVSASVRAAVFAKKQELKEKTHHKNIGKETYRLPSYALVSINIPGVRRNKAEIFDFISSRTVVPPIQNRQNIPLTEVELERLALLKSPLSWPYSEERDRIVPFTEKLAQKNAEKFTQSVPASHGIYFSFLPGFESHQGFLYSYSHKL